jgi:hypothetical protein
MPGSALDCRPKRKRRRVRPRVWQSGTRGARDACAIRGKSCSFDPEPSPTLVADGFALMTYVFERLVRDVADRGGRRRSPARPGVQEPSPSLSARMQLVNLAVQAAASASLGDAFGRALTFGLPVKRDIVRESLRDTPPPRRRACAVAAASFRLGVRRSLRKERSLLTRGPRRAPRTHGGRALRTPSRTSAANATSSVCARPSTGPERPWAGGCTQC